MGLLCSIDEGDHTPAPVHTRPSQVVMTHSPYHSPHLVHHPMVHSPVVTHSHMH